MILKVVYGYFFSTFKSFFIIIIFTLFLFYFFLYIISWENDKNRPNLLSGWLLRMSIWNNVICFLSITTAKLLHVYLVQMENYFMFTTLLSYWAWCIVKLLLNICFFFFIRSSVSIFFFILTHLIFYFI